MNAPEPGSTIDGFLLGEMIHAGTMASIFRLAGRDGPLPLVMKIPRLGPSERAVNVIGFEVCRTVLGALAQGTHHPTLVAYGDVETTPYLVMEYVDGVRLNDWLDRAPMPPEEVARLGFAVAMALDELHRQDVVHLDLKPTNIVFRPNGEAVLIDFGLAHHGHYPDLLAEELRVPHGNWAYMAPEQPLGVRCDPRSDLYALGGILYELATGRLPFGLPRSVAELRRRLYRDAVPPRSLVSSTPDWLQEIVLRCMEVDARDRYSSARELAAALSTPAQVAVTERGLRQRRADLWTLARRRFAAARFAPAPCPPPTVPSEVQHVVVVAIDPQGAGEPLREAMRGAARGAIAADPHCRLACVMVVPPVADLSGEGEENTATGRQIRCLVELRRWARPLELPEERVTYHVLESDKPAAALIDYATTNEVDHILIGPPPAAAPMLRFVGVSAQVIADARCTVTIVRPRMDGETPNTGRKEIR
jgi:nucleotide-binding universal stress UspA family protein